MIRLLLRSPGKASYRNLILDGSTEAVDTDMRLWVSAKDAVAAMIKRLAHRNANVQLYTLEVRGPFIGKAIFQYSHVHLAG